MGRIVSHSAIIILDPSLCDVCEHLSPEAVDELFDADKSSRTGIVFILEIWFS